MKFGWVRRQRFPDDLVGRAGAVEVRGVDVGDSEFDNGTQYIDGCGAIGRRSEDVRAGELHRPVAHAGEGEVVGEGEGSPGSRAFAARRSRCPRG